MAQPTNLFLKQARLLFLLVVAALAGGVSGVIFAYSPDLPAVTTLDDYAPSTITRVYATGGEEIGQFATERRVIIGHDEIPEVLRQALISSEDANFFNHFGFDLRRLGITAVQNVLKWRRRGASTLTMQLARHVSLDGADPLGIEKFWSRKINEAILTIQIEKRYTKREILTLYCNQMYLGSGAHGVEAAARLYFGKSAINLTLPEAALIAGIFQTPSRQSPLVNPDLAVERRNYVLTQMAENGFISDDEAKAAISSALVLAERTPGRQQVAHFPPHDAIGFRGKVPLSIDSGISRQVEQRVRRIEDIELTAPAVDRGAVEVTVATDVVQILAHRHHDDQRPEAMQPGLGRELGH